MAEPTQETGEVELRVTGTGDMIPLPKLDSVIVGRSDPAGNNQPDVDLAPFQGFRYGVSRQHVAIARRDGGLWLRVLGNTNGTFVNNLPVAAGVEHPLSNGDELKLGALRLQVVVTPAPASSAT